MANEEKVTPQERIVLVTPQGISFGNCWISHEKITGYSAEQLNSGNCKIIGNQYMEWLKTPSLPDVRIKELSDMVVMVFSHEQHPEYTQGYQDHEMVEPITAGHATASITRIKNLEELLGRAFSLIHAIDATHTAVAFNMKDFVDADTWRKDYKALMKVS